VLNWKIKRVNSPAIVQQIAACWPTERNLSVVGSFTRLALPTGTLPIEARTVRGSIFGLDIDACDGVEGGGGALLFIDVSGRIEMLEILAYGDYFDSAVAKFKLADNIEQSAHPNAGIASRLQFGAHWRGVTDPERWL
jgi:hypothetical protein